MLTIYRYVTASPHKEKRTIPPKGIWHNGSPHEVSYVEWSQCCHMAWIAGLHSASIAQIAQMMVENDNGYVATFLCSINASEGYYVRQARTNLIKLGFRKLADILGPSKNLSADFHGDNMEIWIYSTVEHKTYRKLREVFKEYLPVVEPPIEPLQAIENIPGPSVFIR